MRMVIGLVTCIFCFSGVAQAARLSSPAIFGAHTQRTASCTVLNSGTAPLDVTVRILNESGEVENITVIGQLLPGEMVPTGLFIDFGVAYTCTVDAASVANLRAAFVIHDMKLGANGSFFERPIRSVPLR